MAGIRSSFLGSPAHPGCHRYRSWSSKFISGFIPPGHHDLLRLLAAHDGLPSMVTAQNVSALQDLGVRWVVIHHYPNYDWQTATATANQLPQLRHVTEVGDSSVYALQPAHAEPLPRLLGRVEVAATAATGAPYAVLVHLHNPNAGARVEQLDSAPRLRLEWLDASGRVAYRDDVRLPALLALPPGDSTRRLIATAPSTSGTYTLRVRASDDTITMAEQQVSVQPATIFNQPALSLVSLSWDQRAVIRPGTTVPVQLGWQVLRDLDDDYAVLLQLLDADGQPRQVVELTSPDAMPPTAGSRAGETISVVANLTIDPALTPGTYHLLVAVFDPASDNQRLLMTLPDGNIIDHAIANDFVVQP